jgi:hypothetical protein
MPTDKERVHRLLAIIAEPFNPDPYNPGDEGWPPDDDDVGMEFFEPAGDWRALLAEIQRLRKVDEGGRDDDR